MKYHCFMDNATDYYLLLADLKHSTQKTPEEAQKILDCTLAEIAIWNDLAAPQLVLPMELNYGDEIAGLFYTPERIYDVASNLRHALRELTQFRFVVSKGHIGAVAKTTSQVNGPIFKTANDALNQLKKDRQFADWIIADAKINHTLNSLTRAADAFRQDMTAYQYKVFRLYRTGMKQKDIAAKLGKYEQSVSDALQRGHADIVIDLDQSINDTLKDLS